MLYTNAINKVSQREKLNRKDVQVLDRIDQITMQSHGVCLKDSLVTKARIKAAKRYGMVFKDRDDLIAHMNMMLGTALEKNDISKKQFMTDFVNELGIEQFLQVNLIARKVVEGKEIDIKEVALLEKTHAIAEKLYGWEIDERARSAINAAYQKNNSTSQTVH